jgi:hypothetical protein
MGWSLGVRLPESEITDAAMLAAGRALYICNQFEAKCRIVLRNMQIIDRIASDPVASLAETFSDLPSSPKMLGGTLEKIKAKAEAFGVTEAQLGALVKAKDARNLIAHEGVDIGPLYSVRSRDILQVLQRLRSAVADVAAGDNIVSTWIYYIEEPREPVPHIRSTYPDLIDRWVFSHLLGGDDSSSWAIAFHQRLPGVPPITRREFRL